MSASTTPRGSALRAENADMIATTLDVPNRTGLYDIGRWLVALVADSADAVRFDPGIRCG